MDVLQFLVKAGIYLLAFVVSYYALGSVNYEKILKQGHVEQARVLYFMLVAALAYLVGSFILAFIY